MATPSIIVKTSDIGETKHIEPLHNRLQFEGYEYVKVTKTGYLWGGIRVMLLKNYPNGKMITEQIGFIGTGYFFESMTAELIVLRKKKKGRVLFNEMHQVKGEEQWQGKTT